MGLWAWTLSQFLSPKFWTLVKKEGFVRTYVRMHAAIRNSHYAGGSHGVAKCVGQDEFGNKYYEDWDVDHRNQRRWVEYSDYFLSIGITVDRIPPRWNGWMCHQYDDVPSDYGDNFVKHHYLKPHSNTTGTPLHHKPLGSPQNLDRLAFIETTKARKSQPWVPPTGDVKFEGKKIVVDKNQRYEDVMRME